MSTHSSASVGSDETARLEKLRAQLATDIESIQQKEASLREYEQRLRSLVEQANQGTRSSFGLPQFQVRSEGDQAALDSEWEKYHRANALLEAARRAMTDDRLAIREREERVTMREVEVARREAWVKNKEDQLAAKAAAEAQAPVPLKPKPSFTDAPFLAAKNLLSLGKSSGS